MNQVWVVRSGEGGYLIKEFSRGYIGIGWNDLLDLTNVHSQEDIRSIYLMYYPSDKPSKVGNAVAMIYKFQTLMQKGDKVITFDPINREYLIGTVRSDYIYKPNEIKDYHHIRKVKWEDKVSRDALSVSTRNSLGSTLSVFSVSEEMWADIKSAIGKEGALDIRDRLEEEKDQLEQIRQETIVRAHELIKDKILRLDERELPQLTAAILRAMDYQARITPEGPDRGVDIIASPDGLGLEQPRIKVEVKHRRGSAMGSKEIRSFIGGLREGDRGLYVSSGGFTKEAKYEADRSQIPVTLLDLDELAELVVTHYEKFDLDGRALIPLVRVYWPAK